METPHVPVSWGELIDKITILGIKSAHLTAPGALANVRREQALLQAIEARALGDTRLADLKAELTSVNTALWEIEDDIRRMESQLDFGPAFVDLARSVYKQNDRRAALKREINLLLDSELFEEKSYAT